MKNIYIYSGEGAYQARDIENCLNVFDMDYSRICEHRLNEIKEKSIFIVPGGMIAAYLPSWGESGKKIIRNFVKNGGIYVGICAGVYVAGKEYKNETGLSFFDQKLEYTKHQSVISAKNSEGETLSLLAENGPDLSLIENSEVVLKDENNKPQAVKMSVSEGEVYLFSSHPEGSVYYDKSPKEFSGAKWFISFLKNL
ncbi:MAG: hypothetical protein HUT38_04565 [Candidatus Paceibacter sp.]|nr:hypothetical protein [Candidatus Paceibacter sp.]